MARPLHDVTEGFPQLRFQEQLSDVSQFLHIRTCMQTNLTGLLVPVRRGTVNIVYSDSSPASCMLSLVMSKWLWQILTLSKRFLSKMEFCRVRYFLVW